MERNDYIRILSPEITIFRGDDFSHLFIDTKVDSRLLTEGETPKYCLSAALEKIDEASNVKQVLNATSPGVDLSFEYDAMKDDSSKCFVFGSNWNKLHCTLGKQVFESNEKFRIVVSASIYGDNRIEYYGYSQEIT